MSTPLLCLLGFLLLSAASVRGELLETKSVAAHIGEVVTVAGTITQVRVSRGGTWFLNFGGCWPKNDFAVVVLRKNTGNFPGMSFTAGRKMEITGTAKLYKKRPQILLSEPAQIIFR